MPHSALATTAVGIGWRQPHYREVLDTSPALDFLEVHSENFFMAGGPSVRALEAARAQYPISLHGVGLALGGADDARPRHLDKLANLVQRIEPALVSEHLCWGGVAGNVLNDLLPLPYTEEALALVSSRVQQLQERLQRPVLIENLSQYIQYQHSTLIETEFLAALCDRTGCQILLDVNNLYVNAQNFGLDFTDLLAPLRTEMIGEIHLAGHLVTPECLIDNHGSRVCDAVWGCYQKTLQRFGPKPTLIEWDTDIPPLATLLAEVALATEQMAQSTAPSMAERT
ncbi:DUF692 domain-containing protein [Parvibium lacunae]|uniref:DUF692 domain-containing protein n=1 Tax=Parvibium lacunae TaxID=1888893 RepID=A0A368L1D3_9BURK|nr:DUF692 domain-containing protein [Parvibium lacunae]RCS57377.1 DUF692 domain-containing protein [Parvibium lacunae]